MQIGPTDTFGAAKKLKLMARPAWKPVTQSYAIDDKQISRVTPTGSRFGGLPFLLEQEDWPSCPKCHQLFTFVVQIDLAKTPKQTVLSKKQGSKEHSFGSGLVQFFFCEECFPYRSRSKEKLVRVLSTKQKGRLAEVPPEHTIMPCTRIKSWALKDTKDYPWGEVRDEYKGREEDILFRLNQQGDKLGGWPNWVQDVEYPRCPECSQPMEHMILQIDSNRNVPICWGDNGTGFVFQCVQHRNQVNFLWQSG